MNLRFLLHLCLQLHLLLLLPGLWVDPGLVHHFALSRAEGCGFQHLPLPSMLRCCSIVPWSVRALPGLGSPLTPCSPSLRSRLSSLTIMKLQIKSCSHSDGNVPFELGHKPDGSLNCFILDIRVSRGPSKKMNLFLRCQKNM